MHLKIAALQYQYDFPSDWESYQQKISHLVGKLASQGVELLLFPEYAGFEMISFIDPEGLQELIPSYLDLFQSLSQQHRMYICAGSQVVETEEGVFNRSYFFSPRQKFSYQDKCNLTPSEKVEGILSQSHTVRLFETSFGKMGICICYDVEFPALVKKLIAAGAKLILVPSYTASAHGFYRVFLSCRARALESQCYVVQSALVGKTDVEIAYGSATICSPVDQGFPDDGLLAIGPRDQPETVIAQLDFAALEKVRSCGQTHNYQDAQLLEKREIHLESFDLR
ncbi:MAG TPA: nitrilase-related carbon-nitrogen hydrolase [Rhabdochlamydiaceae bacterium]